MSPPPINISFKPMKCPTCEQETRTYDPICDWCGQHFHTKCGFVTEAMSLCRTCMDSPRTGGGR